MQNTATIEWTRRRYHPKFERYEIRKTRVKAHNPQTIDAQEGDIVRIQECRPLSKTKKFIIIEKLGKAKLYETKKELAEASKVAHEEENNERS